VFIGISHKTAPAVAWDSQFGHVRASAVPRLGIAVRRAMASQRASQSVIGEQAAAAFAASAESAPLKLEHFLPYQLNVVASLVSQALSRVYARRYRIGVPEWRVLVTLGQYGVMTGKAIGAHTHMHKTKVSRAVALLAKRKLLVRRGNRADKRESFLSLTATGHAMYEELAPHALAFANKLTEILTPADREAFNRAVAQLTERSAQLVAEVAREGEDK
jgi:DNA-binding MarR family transcriptional regulator